MKYGHMSECPDPASVLATNARANALFLFVQLLMNYPIM
jgi:hypothetical protein